MAFFMHTKSRYWSFIQSIYKRWKIKEHINGGSRSKLESSGGCLGGFIGAFGLIFIRKSAGNHGNQHGVPSGSINLNKFYGITEKRKTNWMEGNDFG